MSGNAGRLSSSTAMHNISSTSTPSKLNTAFRRKQSLAFSKELAPRRLPASINLAVRANRRIPFSPSPDQLNSQPMAAYVEHISPKSLTAPLKPCRRAGTSDNEGTKPACASDSERRPSCLPSAAGFLVLTANCAAAVYHSRNDPSSVAFVVAAFLILVSLFYALRVFESLPRESPRRAHVKAAVWVLSTALTLMFSQRVATLMPFPAAVLVWVMAASTISAGFYMFFVCPDGAMAAAEEPAKASDIP